MTTTLRAQQGLRCEECGSECSEVDGEFICMECGLVQSTPVLVCPTVSTHSFARHPLIASCWTELGAGYDGKAKRLSPIALRKARRLESLQKRLRYQHRAPLFRALLKLNRFASVLVLPTPVHLRAAFILRACLPEWTHRGPSIILASILYAAREYDYPLRAYELLQLCPSPRPNAAARSLRVAYSSLQAKLGSRPGPPASVHVNRIGSMIGAGPELQQHALGILEDRRDAIAHRGHNRCALAGAALLLAGAKVSQQKVALNAGVTEYTIRKALRFLRDHNQEGGEK